MATTGQTSSERRGIAFGMVAMGMALSLAFTPEAAIGEGVTGYYIGNAAHSLQTLANWKDQVRPGRFTDDGKEVGDYGGTMVFDNNSTGWGVRLTSTAMLSVSNIIFRGENLQRPGALLAGVRQRDCGREAPGPLQAGGAGQR